MTLRFFLYSISNQDNLYAAAIAIDIIEKIQVPHSHLLKKKKNNKIIVTNVPNKMSNPRRNNNKNAMSLIVEFFMTI